MYLMSDMCFTSLFNNNPWNSRKSASLLASQFKLTYGTSVTFFFMEFVDWGSLEAGNLVRFFGDLEVMRALELDS
jgi:hypothetical protein